MACVWVWPHAPQMRSVLEVRLLTSLQGRAIRQSSLTLATMPARLIDSSVRGGLGGKSTELGGKEKKRKKWQILHTLGDNLNLV